MTLEPIVGRYLNLSVEGVDCRIYFEESGRVYLFSVSIPPAPTVVSTVTS